MSKSSQAGVYTCHFCTEVFVRAKKYKRPPNVLACPDCIDTQVHYIRPHWETSKLEQGKFFHRSMSTLKSMNLPFDWYETQGGKCALCDTTDPGGHGTWIISLKPGLTPAPRGILCYRCHLAVSVLESRPEFLERFASFLAQ